MKTIQLEKDDQAKMDAAFKANQAAQEKSRAAQLEAALADQKYKKLLLHFVAKGKGEPADENGRPIAWEYIEDEGALVGVPQTSQQISPQQMQQMQAMQRQQQ